MVLSVGAAAPTLASGRQNKVKPTNDKYPKYPYLYHKWTKCDLSPHTTDVHIS